VSTRLHASELHVGAQLQDVRNALGLLLQSTSLSS
jgi:hypothetical protein